MGKNKGGGKAADQRARDKVDHRGGGRGGKRRGSEDEDAEVPQELIEKAALLGCQVWEIDEYEQR